LMNALDIKLIDSNLWQIGSSVSHSNFEQFIGRLVRNPDDKNGVAVLINKSTSSNYLRLHADWKKEKQSQK